MTAQFTIYLHRNRINGKGYIGQTKRTMHTRWFEHVLAANNKGKCRLFARAIKKHGPEAFDHKILVTVKTAEEAGAAEKLWIAQLNTRAPNGYNLSEGGTVFNTHEESRRRIGDASRARNAAMSAEQRGIPKIKMWEKRTPEQRSALARKSAAAWSPERRSEVMRQNWAKLTQEQREKRTRNAAKGAEKATEIRVESLRRAHATKTPEQRSAIARKAWARSTPKQRSDRVRNAAASTTTPRAQALRSASLKKAWASMSPEDRCERANRSRVAILARTKEERGEWARKANASRTPQQRSEAGLKAAKKRAQKGAAEVG